MIHEALLIAKGEKEVGLLPRMANRHGLVVGATGAGKTVTLRVLALGEQGAEQFFGEPALNLQDFMQTDSDGQGVGIYFVTQNPVDLPDTVLGSLFGGGRR